jgi:predicted HicB family RNase H-like nuclease
MTKTNEIQRYTYRVEWSEEDGEFVATCAEFSSLSWLAESPVAAINGIIVLVHDVAAGLRREHQPIPEPLSGRSYSGRFIVRTTPALHARLVREAAEQHVSLNQLAAQKLAVG